MINYLQQALTDEELAKAIYFLNELMGYELIFINNILYKSLAVEEPHAGVIPSLRVEGAPLNNWIKKNYFQLALISPGIVKDSGTLSSEIGKLKDTEISYSNHYDYIRYI